MNDDKAQANRLVLRKLVVLAVAMFGFGYLLVPLYEKICEVTGLREIARADAPAANTQVDRTRLVTMEFDANIRSDLPWRFKPLQGSLKVHPGELVQVKSKEEIAATLSPEGRNRGLWFDREMLPYCGGTYRVRQRVNRIIDEASASSPPWRPLSCGSTRSASPTRPRWRASSMRSSPTPARTCSSR